MIRSTVAVIGGLALTSLLTQLLEFAVVSAAGGGVTDMPGYFAVRNRPGVFAAVLASGTLVAVLGGYIAAKVAGQREVVHGLVMAAIQTAALAFGATVGDFATMVPLWMRIATVLVTGPAMLAGAAIRQAAVRAGA
jgi:hypothetical protein